MTNAELTQVASLLAAQAQEIERRDVQLTCANAEFGLAIKRAEAAEARVREIESATFERCARIAAEMLGPASTVAAAIRALKATQ
jgi:hypothetical protein